MPLAWLFHPFKLIATEIFLRKKTFGKNCFLLFLKKWSISSTIIFKIWIKKQNCFKKHFYRKRKKFQCFEVARKSTIIVPEQLNVIYRQRRWRRRRQRRRWRRRRQQTPTLFRSSSRFRYRVGERPSVPGNGNARFGEEIFFRPWKVLLRSNFSFLETICGRNDRVVVASDSSSSASDSVGPNSLTICRLTTSIASGPILQTSVSNCRRLTWLCS